MNFVFYLHDEPSVEAFEQKLLWFKSRYTLVSAQDVYEHLYEGTPLRNACHLTVDDGWLSTYRTIFPVMRKYGVPFTIFVSPQVCTTGRNFWYKDMIGVNESEMCEKMYAKGLYRRGIERFPLDLLFKEVPVDVVYSLLDEYWTEHGQAGRQGRSFVNAEELREMRDSGLVEIGAHTLTHPILAAENAQRAAHEIKQSVEQLSALIDREVTTFAYPNGLQGVDFEAREMQVAREAGIKLAFSVNSGLLSSSVDKLAIPRIGSTKRLLLGRLGVKLPSLARQASKRKAIRGYLLSL